MTPRDVWVGDGLTLQEKYADGPRTFLGLSSHGFPNLFFMMGPQGSPPIANYIAMGEEQAKWITDVVSHVRSGGDDATNSLPPSVSISAEGTDAARCGCLRDVCRACQLRAQARVGARVVSLSRHLLLPNPKLGQTDACAGAR